MIQLLKSLFSRKDPEPSIDPLVASFQKGECPDCGSDSFLMGPSAGIMVNVECYECSSRFNIGMAGSTVFHAERI